MKNAFRRVLALVLALSMMLIPGVSYAGAVKDRVAISYNGGSNIIGDVPSENVGAEFVESLYPVAKDHKDVKFPEGTKWTDGLFKSGDVFYPVMYLAVEPGEKTYGVNDYVWYYPAVGDGQYDMYCRLISTYSTNTERALAFAVNKSDNASADTQYFTHGGAIDGCIGVYDYIGTTQVLKAPTLDDHRNGTDTIFAEIEVKLYKKGTKDAPDFPYLYIAFSDIDAAQSFKISSEGKKIETGNMFIRSTDNWPKDTAYVKNMYNSAEGSIYSEHKIESTTDGDKHRTVSSNEDPTKILTVYNKVEGISTGVNVVYGYAAGAGAGLEFLAKKIKIDYKSDSYGTVSGITTEGAFEGGNPRGSSTTPDDGYKLNYWICDKAVRLSGSSDILPAGTHLTAEQIKNVVAMEDLTFTAYHEPYYTVEYVVEEDPIWGVPEGSRTPVDPTEYSSGAAVTVKDDLSTLETSAKDDQGKDVPGTWTFTPWNRDDFVITENTVIEGAWIFKPDPVNLVYVVKPDEDWGMPADSTTPTGGALEYNTPVTIADDRKTTQQTAHDDSTGKDVPGTWTFGPWDHSNFNITEDTTVSGIWNFEPLPVDLTYVVKPDENWGVPAGSTTPAAVTDIPYGDSVTVEGNLSTTVTTAKDPYGNDIPGAWTFTPWDKSGSFEIKEDTVVTGSWTFTPNAVKVEYKVTPDPHWGSPDDSSVPGDEAYFTGDAVTVKDDLVPVHGYAKDPDTGSLVMGTWVFGSWDKDDFIITEDTVISGSWKFVPDPDDGAETYRVRYKAVPDDEWGIPEGSKAPRDDKDYEQGDKVIVKDDLTSDQDYAIDPKTGEKVPGKWTFTPWDKDDFKITENTTITGSWSFTPDTGIGGGDPETYKVSYEPKPDDIWGIPEDASKPSDATYSKDDKVIVADDPVSEQDYAIDPKTGEKVPGKWTFTPWDKDDFVITEDTVITGSWSFTPDTGIGGGDPAPGEVPGTSEGGKPEGVKPGDEELSSEEDPEEYFIPKTGDHSNIGLWTAMLVISAAALIAAVRKRKAL